MPAAIIFGVCVAVAAAAQTSLVPHLAIGDIRPSIVIVLVACVALVRGPVTGCGLGLFGGFLLAALDGRSVGLEIAGAMVAGFLAGTVRGKVFTERRTIGFLVGLGSVVVAELVSGALDPPAPPLIWLRVIGLEAVYSAIFAVPLYILVCWLDRLLPGRSDEGI